MAESTVDVAVKGGIVFISIGNDLTGSRIVEVKEMIGKAITEGKLQIAINMDRVGPVEESGVRMLLEKSVEINEKSGKIVLFNLYISTAKNLKASDLAEHIQFCKSEKEALAAFSKEQTQ